MSVTLYKQNMNFRLRNIAKQNVLFGNGKAFKMNETAVLIWENLDGSTSVDSIIDLIVDTYKCEKTLAIKDTNSFICFLHGIDAIKEV
ncbi:hypothetical protein ABD76_09395 [Paenibacillus dendritiformis]|uniref:PqqD family protein n=1 Tax=Paenibacillus dendritiformis TaxID=130049 RepID=UPI0018CC81DD|nr:PqqD family protein [Paenibacillus dendritiformis]MBG9792695.1 hypothetical protein [Paenibacillus dendritiformis]